MKKIIIINVVVVVVLILIGVAFALYLSLSKDNLAAVDPSDKSKEVITVEEGVLPSKLFNTLEEKNLILDADAATEYCVEINCTLYVGNYEISRSMRADEIVDYLQKQSNMLSNDTFVLREGDDLTVYAEELSVLTDYSSDEILDFWNDTDNINSYIEDYWYITDEVLDPDIKYPLEGYFPPLTYDIESSMTLEQITNMILNYGLQEYDQYKDVDNGYTFHEMLTLASIIERETIFDEDKPIVSEVFYNRIDNETEYGYLQSDITVLYALGEHKEIVTYEDLEVDDPYNTYVYKGLTPGPIGSPSAASLEAAYYPDDNDYYFFFADSDGVVHYAETLAEHEEIICTYSPENAACS